MNEAHLIFIKFLQKGGNEDLNWHLMEREGERWGG